MRAVLLPLVRRRTRPPLALGIIAMVLFVVVETALAVLLVRVAPIRSLGVIYLPGIVAVATLWGIWCGMMTAVLSTLALDFFLIPPTGSLTLNKGEDWAVLAVFLIVTFLAGSISRLGRSLVVEADSRAEADLSAELARVLLHAPDLATAVPRAAALLERALNLSPVTIQLGEACPDDSRTEFYLNGVEGVPMACLLVPAGLPRATMRRLRERVVPSLEVLLQAARERERVTGQQGALRRLATLIAHRTPPGEVFAAVACEAGQVLQARHVAVIRFEPDGTATTVGAWNSGGRLGTMPPGENWRLEKGTAAEQVARTGAPARVGPIQAHAGAGRVLTTLANAGIKSAVGCPIRVGGRLWGTMIAASTSEPMSSDTENLLLDFTDLVVTAIVNAESQANLEASRARVIAAADATRRLIERDLHDGTQQRLVSLMLELRAMEAIPPEDPQEFRRLLSETAQSLKEALDDLQGLARGLHPALLSRRGLEPAIKALARCSSVPVELNVSTERLGERTEVTAYHVVSEALSNAAEHAKASLVCVDLCVEDGAVRLSIKDDGKGGADPGRGAGLLGIQDRVEALGGRLKIVSPAGGGTSVFAEIPVVEDQ